jgi:hypothetical protein
MGLTWKKAALPGASETCEDDCSPGFSGEYEQDEEDEEDEDEFEEVDEEPDEDKLIRGWEDIDSSDSG